MLKYLEVKHLWLTINSVCMCNRENKYNMLTLIESRVEGITIIWISLYAQNVYNNSWRKTKKHNSTFKSVDNMLQVLLLPDKPWVTATDNRPKLPWEEPKWLKSCRVFTSLITSQASQHTLGAF